MNILSIFFNLVPTLTTGKLRKINYRGCGRIFSSPSHESEKTFFFKVPTCYLI